MRESDPFLMGRVDVVASPVVADSVHAVHVDVMPDDGDKMDEPCDGNHGRTPSVASSRYEKRECDDDGCVYQVPPAPPAHAFPSIILASSSPAGRYSLVSR